MKGIRVVKAVAGFLACISATVFSQGCNSTPGALGGGAGGNAGSGVVINLGGQAGTRSWSAGGSRGSVAADAAIVDVATARKDAPIEVKAADTKAAPPIGADGAQAIDQAAVTVADARQATDQAAKADVGGKEVVVRDTVGVMDAKSPPDKSPPDVAVADGPPAAVDASVADVAASGDVPAAGCRYDGVTYAVGDSFPNDCNTCFCLAGGDVVCTVKACAVDGGAG